MGTFVFGLWIKNICKEWTYIFWIWTNTLAAKPYRNPTRFQSQHINHSVLNPIHLTCTSLNKTNSHLFPDPGKWFWIIKMIYQTHRGKIKYISDLVVKKKFFFRNIFLCFFLRQQFFVNIWTNNIWNKTMEVS